MILSKIQKNRAKSHKQRRNEANSRRGFTILETLVAILILMLSITGPLVFTQNALKIAFVSRDQISAFYLAQDAIEYIKNTRDDNILDGNDNWLFGLSNCQDSGGCTLDTIDNDIVGCPNGDGCSLDDQLQKYSDGTFGIGSGGEDSGFSRLVTINEISSDVEAEVTIEIQFITNTGANRTVVVKEYIYNWAGNLGI